MNDKEKEILEDLLAFFNKHSVCFDTSCDCVYIGGDNFEIWDEFGFDKYGVEKMLEKGESDE